MASELVTEAAIIVTGIAANFQQSDSVILFREVPPDWKRENTMARRFSIDEPSQRLWIEDLGILTLSPMCTKLVAALVMLPPYATKAHENLITQIYQTNKSSRDKQNIFFLWDDIKKLIRRELKLGGHKEGDDKEGVVELHVFWLSVRGVGYRVKDDWEYVPWEGRLNKGPVWIPPDDRLLESECRDRVEQNEIEVIRRLGKSAQNLSYNSLPSEHRLLAFKELVYSSLALLQRKKVNLDVVEGISNYVLRLQRGGPAIALELASHLGEELQKALELAPSHQLYRALFELCYACWGYFEKYGNDVDEAISFHRAFEAADYLSRFGLLKADDIAQLEEWLRRTYRRFRDLRRLEYRALYLEEFATVWQRLGGLDKVNLFLLEAGVESLEVATLAASEDMLQFAAGMNVRAAKCFQSVGKRFLGAAALVTAGDQMTRSGCVSKWAIQCYREAIELLPEAPNHYYLEQRIANLNWEWEEINKLRYKVVILANVYDTGFADALVDPLAKSEIRCDFEVPEKVENLLDLAAYDGCIIIGGIHAPYTRKHLRQYFYQAAPIKSYTDVPIQHILTFETIDDRPFHHCCIFWASIEDKPFVVLAGLTRDESCQAILNFIEEKDGLFRDFVNSVRKEGQIDHPFI